MNIIAAPNIICMLFVHWGILCYFPFSYDMGVSLVVNFVIYTTRVTGFVDWSHYPHRPSLLDTCGRWLSPPAMITHLLWNIINSILTSNDLNHIVTMKQNYLHALWIYNYYETSLSPPALTTSLIWIKITSTHNTYWIIYGTSLPPPALTTSLCFGIAERDFSIGFFAFFMFYTLSNFAYYFSSQMLLLPYSFFILSLVLCTVIFHRLCCYSFELAWNKITSTHNNYTITMHVITPKDLNDIIIMKQNATETCFR